MEERIEGFARDVAEETRKALTDLDVKMLIVAGNEVMTTALESVFHSSVQDRVIASIPMDIRSSDHDVLNETLPPGCTSRAGTRDRGSHPDAGRDR